MLLTLIRYQHNTIWHFVATYNIASIFRSPKFNLLLYLQSNSSSSTPVLVAINSNQNPITILHRFPGSTREPELVNDVHHLVVWLLTFSFCQSHLAALVRNVSTDAEKIHVQRSGTISCATFSMPELLLRSTISAWIPTCKKKKTHSRSMEAISRNRKESPLPL